MVGQGKCPCFNWTDASKLDLLLAIYKHANPTPTQWEKIIEETAEELEGYRKHFEKKREAPSLYCGHTVEGQYNAHCYAQCSPVAHDIGWLSPLTTTKTVVAVKTLP
ncbi:hypothetical protein PG988_005610 [Apiospora saccharicola]